MTDSQTKQIQDIEALLAERRKYEQWIAQLEDRRASTPEHVYTKVLGDYQSRLNETQSKLSAESGAVQKIVANLATSLAAHERQITEKRDERAEAELRAAVGEYGEKEWEKLRGKLDTAIAAISSERETIEREHDTLRALLSEATKPTPTPTPAVARAVEPPAAKPERPAPRASAETAKPALAEAPTGPGRKSDVDELAFLRSVLGRSTPYTNSGGQPAVNAPVVDPPALRDTGAHRAAAAAAAAAAPAKSEEKAKGGTFTAPTPKDNEVVKTLKCQECGTMNFPTEWYCERCGGELAAF